MLTPTKRSKVEQSKPESVAKPPPTHQELFRWTLTKDAIALCHIKDVYSLQERTVAGPANLPQANKQPDFYWLGRTPCRVVQIVGLVVGVSQYEGRTIYIVDDGTEVIECIQRLQPLNHSAEPGKPPTFAPEFPLPLASVSDCVCVVGRASKTKSNEWQVQVNSIELCSARNEELIHHLKVRKLHETNYSLSIPFYPSLTTQVDTAIPVTPTRKQALQEPSSKVSNFAAQSSPVTVISSSPVKSEQTPTKLRHPSRLHHVELTRNTFRIYLKYYMDTGPYPSNETDDNDDLFAQSFAPEFTRPTKNDATPRPTQFSTTRSRPNIDPIYFGTSTTSSSKAREDANSTQTTRGYTVSYLRRVPELVLLATRVAKQETRLARKQEKEKKSAASSSSSATKSTTARSSRARNPTSKDIKRLFLRAVNDLYREGSIVIWDCPAYPCNDAAFADTFFLWKPMTTHASGILSLSYASSCADTTAASSILGHSTFPRSTSGAARPPAVPEDGDGDLSDPDPNEDVYIELGIAREQSFAEEILWALGLRVFCSALIAYLGWLSNDSLSQLRARVTSHFDVYLMEVKLKLDIPTSLDAGNKVDASGNDAWGAFDEILNYHQGIIELLSQILVIYKEARDVGGSGFVLICLAKPFYGQLFYTPLWQKVCYGYVNNEAYLRIEALKELASGRFREDVLTSDMGSWIIEQYKASRENIGNLSDEHPILQVDHITSPIERVVQGILEDLPMVYCGLNVIISPSRFSLSNIAIMQTASTTLRNSIAMLFYRNRNLGKNLNTIREIYSVSKIRNQVDGGKTSYPSSEKSAKEGMSFELRDLSFSYPGSHKTTCALNKINLKIPGSSVVVIVGSNGSGKSTLIRILSRLFTPSSGELLIDGSPAEDFDLVDLRQASMLLSQDNKVYPLSLAENIGLGCLELVEDMNLIENAAERGGAAGFISKLDTGYGTVLSPTCPTVMLGLYGDANHPLHKEIEKLPKKTNISGGETQRLVAARSFMRLNSGKVKFIAVDEPSSALDAEGELQLFNRLLEVREGKTVLFVTHRFGHLTNHADMILYVSVPAIYPLKINIDHAVHPATDA
ncbi:hypothetical protein H1R20_g11818, partial [Candolleomyces eurysporus]